MDAILKAITDRDDNALSRALEAYLDHLTKRDIRKIYAAIDKADPTGEAGLMDMAREIIEEM